ncbi:hypothetical protein SBDP1_140009 [Syntrophobacter sp. SbD1]|nr:hypothetical protein SBDP1_140009 [Syntrophobacter sp. SbD1]
MATSVLFWALAQSMHLSLRVRTTLQRGLWKNGIIPRQRTKPSKGANMPMALIDNLTFMSVVVYLLYVLIEGWNRLAPVF